MSRGNSIVVVALALAVAGCTSMRNDGMADAGTAVGPSGNVVPTMAFTPPAGATLARRVQVQNVSDGTATDGVVNTVHMYSNGTAFAVIQGSNEAVEGQWVARNNDVCFTWPVRGQECWPNAMTMTSGQNMTMTSDRGVTARMTGM